MTSANHNSRRCRSNGRSIRCLAMGWALSAITFLAASVQAQVDFSTSSTTADPVLVETAEVLENAASSFRFAAVELIATQPTSNAGIGTDDVDIRIDKLTDAFRRDATRLVNELKGDGVLEAGEVSEGMAELREQHLERLRQTLAALEANAPPPPQADQFATRVEYLRALGHYTLRVRNSASDWLLLGAAVFGGVFIAWLLSVSLHAGAVKITGFGSRNGARMLRALAGPSYLAAVTIALHTASGWLWIPGIASVAIDRAANALLIAALFWFSWSVCYTLAQGIAWFLGKTYNRDIDAHSVLILSRVLRIIALLIFTMIIVHYVLDSNLTGMVAGLGILGVAVSFILRGTIENIAASFTLLGDKPFRVGDLIVHEGTWGTVESIGFRSTRFRSLNGHLLTIPNSRLIDHDIHNAGSRPSIRRRFRIGIPYTTSVDKLEEALEIVRDLLKDHRGQPQDQPAHVEFEHFGEYELRLLVQYYFEPADYWQALAFDTEFNLALFRRFKEAGIEFAFPTQSLFLHEAGTKGQDGTGAEVQETESGNDQRTLAAPQTDQDSCSPMTG